MTADNSRQEVLLSAARTERQRPGQCADGGGHEYHGGGRGVHALGRAVLACLPELQTWDKPVGIVDIGASAMTFAVPVQGQVIYSRLQNFGGDQYSQALASFTA